MERSTEFPSCQIIIKRSLVLLQMLAVKTEIIVAIRRKRMLRSLVKLENPATIRILRTANGMVQAEVMSIRKIRLANRVKNGEEKTKYLISFVCFSVRFTIFVSVDELIFKYI